MSKLLDGEQPVSMTVEGVRPAIEIAPPMRIFRCRLFQDELVRAERGRTISEFEALAFHAIRSICEGSGCVDDYLTMLEPAARTVQEHGIVRTIRLADRCRLLAPDITSRRCLELIGDLARTERLARALIIALACTRDLDLITAVQRGIGDEADGYRREPIRTHHVGSSRTIAS